MTTKGGKGGLKVTGPETRRYHNLMGTHLIYLGNVLAGVLNVTFAEAPWPTWMWIWLRGPKGEYLEDLVAEANDDPKYDDKIKERVKAGKKAPWGFVEHCYAALMAEGLSAFIVFNCKNNLFKGTFDENQALETAVYLIAGLGSTYAMYASLKRKWVESSFPVVMAAGLISTICLIFLDKGGVSVSKAQKVMYIKKWIPVIANALTRRYKKRPSKVTTLKHRKLGVILLLILFPLNLWTMKHWVRSGVTNIVQGTFTTGLPLTEFNHVVQTRPKGYFNAAKMLTFGLLGKKDKYKKKKAHQFVAALYVECYMPYTEEEMTPYEARQILQVDEDADKKRLHKAYRDASRRYHPDKYAGGKDEAEKMQEKVSIARTILGYYQDRFEDGRAMIAIQVAQTMGWEIPKEFSHRVEGGEKEEQMDVDDPATIAHLAETQCEQMEAMYFKFYHDDLVDLGIEGTPDCLTLANNFKEMLRIEIAIQSGKEPVPYIKADDLAEPAE